MNKVKKGGITYGKSHAEGGIKVKNASTGDMLEVEGGEGIVNKRSMASDKQVKLNGKDMSLCEAVSQLNQMEGGVQFNCDDVADRQFLEEMALGGELERGTRTEKEHIQVLNDLYAKRITPNQATRRIAKDHIKEDSRYYSKLAEMEGKMAKGGKISEKQLLIDYQNEFLQNNYSTNLNEVHKSSEYPSVINQRKKMAKSYAIKKIAENKPKRFFDVTYRTKFGAYYTERNILAVDQNQAWSEVKRYNSDIAEKYSIVLSKVQPKTNEQKMAHGGKIADVNNLEGSIVKIYDAGVKDPIFFVVKSAKMSDPSFRYKTLFLTSSEGYVEEIDDTKIEAFLRGEQIQMKTRGTNNYYALQLTDKKMKLKYGGKTDEDCGCGSTYAEGGFVEDKTPLLVGDVAYIIEPSKPRNEWLRGVYLEKSGNDAKVIITDSDANQYEKVVPLESLIKLDIAQANPSDFKEFIEDFGKAKSNYFDNISAVSIIESRIDKAKKYPNPNPDEQKKILDGLKNELSKAKSSAEQGKKELSGLSQKPSAFYRYGKGGVVQMSTVSSILDTIGVKGVFRTEFETQYLRLLPKPAISFFDLSVPLSQRTTFVGKYSYERDKLPKTTIPFEIEKIDDSTIRLEFKISTRSIKNKGISWWDLKKYLYKIGFSIDNSDMTYAVSNDSPTRSKRFTFYFRRDYYNLFETKEDIIQLLNLFQILAVMLMVEIPFVALEDLKGNTIDSVLAVFKNKTIWKNIDYKEGGEGGKEDGKGGGSSYWRFKTEQELKDEYGENWANKIGFASDGGMDYLLGKRIEDFRLINGQPQLGSKLNSVDAYGISSGGKDDDNLWSISTLKPFKFVVGQEDSEGGKDDKIEEKINQFLETYDEQKESPQYFKPKTGESEARPILRFLAERRLMSKDAWDECIERNKRLDDLAEKVKDLPADAVLYKVLMPKIIENANILYEIGRELSLQWDKTLTVKMSDGERRDFPILMMKFWQHKPSLDSSIFE